MNDGINVKEAKALKTIYEWIRNVEFLSNFPDKNQTAPKFLKTYIVDMSWTRKNLQEWRIGVVAKVKKHPKSELLQREFQGRCRGHSCENPILTLSRGEPVQMDMALSNWPLIDGYSNRIGVFKYTLHFDKKKDPHNSVGK